jgi:hypothetical protein
VKLKPKMRVPEQPCPYCGAVQDAVSGTTSRYPEPGDVSVCIHCAGASIFDEQLCRKKWPATHAVPPDVERYQQIIRSLKPS